ncbi:nicotinate-nucleotide adenylyltransferase [Edaphobacter bradus]|uniref:nicotinate-nucleotide adenylyltransferase n=1 Tax=Edaphobacter bradus TaxID=2259016 RepID=UPI0021DFDACB|nr:nicotinate-nucleotide adenylyltransferase [Edaphobacter bradus]
MVNAAGRQRVALFGGTFDPPHHGHLSIAQAAADAFALKKVLFTPVGHQPLKPGESAAPFADRLAMVRLACAEDSRFEASAIDAPHPNGSPNYTVETLNALRREMPEAELFSVAGADSFLTLRQWREPDRLLELAEWIVVSRPGSPLRELAGLDLSAEQRKRVHLVETVHEEVSATELRHRLEAGEDCTGLIPEAVARYIAKNHLYR